MPDISPREWRWLGAASAVVLILFSMPYLVGWLSGSPHSSFSGFLIGLEDMYSYIAKMRYGARDGWTYQLVYTAEPQTGGYVFLPFLALGKLSGLITGQGASVSTGALIAAFHIARIVCGAALLIVLYVFVARWLNEPTRRRIAWVIAIFGGGFGWLEALAQQQSSGFHLPPVEYYIPEGFTSLVLLGLPHVELSRALMLVGWLALIAGVESGRWRPVLLASLLWLGVGLCVPFYTVLTAIVVGAWLAGLWLVRRKLPLREAGMALAAGALAGVYALYNYWLFSTNPIFAIWSSQNYLPSPPLYEYGIAYALLAGLAIAGAIPLIRRGLDDRFILVVIWPVVALIMAYLPINVQRRLLESVIVPLAILATLGLAEMWNARPGWLRPAALATAGLLGLSSVFFLFGESIVATNNTSLLFHPADEIAALDWLAGHAPPDSVVLSTHESGMMLPAYAPVRVYVGHGPETVHSGEKTAMAERFFGNALSNSDRTDLLRDSHIRYVWIGQQERQLACQSAGCLDPKELGLVEVFRAGDYAIEEVTR